MICPHPPCQKEFTPSRPHQRYCSSSCRMNNHAASDGGLRGVASSVRKLRRGGVSVVIRFDAISSHNALQIEIGALVEVIK